MARRRLSKNAADVRLLDMPLPKGRMAECQLLFKADTTELRLHNLEATVAWQLALPRLTKAEPSVLAQTFSVEGSRHVRAFKDVPAEPAAALSAMAGGDAAVTGVSEFGLQTDDDKEYFLSKFGDLVGVVRIKRTEKGWSAGIAKDNVPRVLSEEAVRDGLMPPAGHSALPRSLEAVVPAAYQYWKAQGDEARAVRDALVESGFFAADCIKAVDGELRKVEVRFFLYEAGAEPAGKRALTKGATLGERIAKLLPTGAPLFTPMVEPGWLETLDKNDTVGTVAVLSPPARDTSAREMVRAAALLKGDFLLEHDDTRVNRAAFASLGRVFKLRGVPDRILVSSFPVADVLKGDDGPVIETVDFQGIRIDLDRPVGFTQTGKDQDGNPWSRTYTTDYGFIPQTNGGDGSSLDVFLGKCAESQCAFWAIQNKADGTFDEHKLFLGFETMREALDAFAAHIPQRLLGDMLEVPVSAVKALLNLEPTALVKSLAGYVAPPEYATRVVKALNVHKDGEEHYVLGVVLEPDVIDAQNDTYSADEVRLASERFMQQYRNVGLMHKGHINDKVQILENYIAPVDFKIGDETVRKGTWMMACRVHDGELWTAIKQGGLTGFSIGGSAIRKPVDEGV